MSNPKKPQKITKVTVFMPESVLSASRTMAAGQSLSTWLVAVAAEKTGTTKSYQPPQWGGVRKNKSKKSKSAS